MGFGELAALFFPASSASPMTSASLDRQQDQAMDVLCDQRASGCR